MAIYPGSRYQHVPTREHTLPDGRIVRYKSMRAVDTPIARRYHTVLEGDRTDILAARYFDEPERFWRIADANLAWWPEDLVQRPGQRLSIPSPED